MQKKKLLTMVELALLTAIVIAFQLMGSIIHIGPTSVSLVLIPIVVGAIIVGPLGGAFLGFVFGAITLWAGISGADGFTQLLFNAQPIATALICLGKGTLAGLCAGLIYRLLQKKNRLLGVFAAAATAPIVNTGLFILGGLTLVSGTLNATYASGTTLIYFLVIGCAGLNFVAEFLLNLVVAPAINTVVFAVQKQFGRRDYH